MVFELVESECDRPATTIEPAGFVCVSPIYIEMLSGKMMEPMVWIHVAVIGPCRSVRLKRLFY